MPRGDGSIYQRGQTFWVCYYRDGEQFREAAKTKDGKTTNDPAVAQKYLKARQDELTTERGGGPAFVTPQANRLTIAELCQALKANYELLGKASKQNLCHLARAEEDFGKIRATKLSPSAIDRYIKQRQNEGAAAATINRTTGMLQSAFQLAVANGELSRVPRITHLSEKGNARKGFLKPAQFEKLLAHIPNDGLRDFVEWGYKTGQRKSETASMKWNMLDSDEGVIRIPGDVCKNREDRTLPLTAALTAIIERRRATQRVKENGRVRLVEFIFHRNAQRIGDFKKTWKAACTKAGVTGTLYHDLRRSFVKNGTNAGIPAALLMRAGGWQSEAMLKRYQIEIDEEVRAAMERTEKYVATAAQAQTETNVVAMGATR